MVAWLPLVLGGVAYAAPTDSPAGLDATGPGPVPGDASLDTIVVEGLRESLGKSLDLKRNAAVVLDSINATELGRFPDDDVADSLSHITGVSITRTTGGEGQYVGIRGLGSQYNIVTLNNRILATDDDGRDLAFDILPADVISGADVLKSSQASAVEGSIGGTVNLRSAHPFDNPGFHAAARVEHSYNDMSYFGGNKGSAFVSDTNDDGTLGLLVGLVYSKVKDRSDALNYNTYDANSPGVWPLTGPTSQPVVAECCISFGSVVDTKRREALSATFEWRPSDTFHLALDGLVTQLHDPQVAYNQAYYPDFAYDPNGNPEWSNVVVKNGFITSFTGDNFTPEVINNTIDRVVTTWLVGLNATWNATPNLTFTGDAYRSNARRPEGGKDAFVTAGLVSPTPNNQDIINWTNTNHGLPNISVTLPNGADYGASMASGALGNDAWSTHYVGLSGYSIHDTVTGTTLDGSYLFDKGPLNRINFGVAYTSREKSRDDVSNDWTGGSSQYNLYTTPVGGTPITFGSLGANVISYQHFPNYMQGAGGSFPHTVAAFNVQSLLNALKTLNGTPFTDISGNPAIYDFANTLPQFNAVNSYKVKEDTTAAYVELAMSGDQWSGNLGVRVVHTSTTASTAVNEIESVTVLDTSNPTEPAAVVYSTPTPTSSKGSYTLPLPSLNLAYWLEPKLQLRLGLAETISRPELNQLAPTRTDNSLNQVYEIDYAGNAKLKPVRSYQADVSVEWYYQPKSALTLAVFGKNLKDFITTQVLTNVDLGVPGYFNGSATAVPVPYQVDQPINGDKGQVRGVELGLQHFFPMGFGVHAQYTHNWSKAYVGGEFVGQLEGVSPSTASLGLIYEQGPISSSVTWDYSGAFIAQTFTEVPGLSATTQAFSWVTAQASYEILRGFKIYVEGKNLSNAIARTYLGGRSDAVWSFGSPITGTGSSIGQGYSAYGRTFTVGASYRF
jgi:iron complex outermembrane receptor protein